MKNKLVAGAFVLALGVQMTAWDTGRAGASGEAASRGFQLAMEYSGGGKGPTTKDCAKCRKKNDGIGGENDDTGGGAGRATHGQLQD